MIKATHLFLFLPIMAATASSIAASEKSPGAKSATPYATVLAPSFPQNRNAINGLITDTSNRPLTRIRVELLDDVEMAIMQTYTDTTGHYSFKGLSTGTFIVKARSDGIHQEQSVRVTLFTLKPSSS